MAEQVQVKKTLGFRQLMAIAVGQIVGAGVMVLAIYALGMTGRSVNVAFILAAVLTIFSTIPYLFVSSVIRINGGTYTIDAIFVGTAYAGWTRIVGLLGTVSVSLFAIGLADYIAQLMPSLSGMKTLLSLGLLTAFFILNYFGTEYMAKVQSLMFYFLIVALVMFTVIGFPQVQFGGYFGNELFGQPFMANGISGLLEASAFLTYATGGATIIVFFSEDAINPKKDFPPVIIISTLAIAVLYGFLATVIGGILPADQVLAAGNLGVIAFEIMPLPLYYFFMIAGAIFALGTTLNSTIGSGLGPIRISTRDGWFPAWLGKPNKHNVPTVYLMILYFINVAVILAQLDVNEIGKWSLIITNVMTLVTALSISRLPKLFPEEWKKSVFYMPNWALTTLMGLSGLSLLLQAYLNLQGLNTFIIMTNIITAVVAAIYVYVRMKSGKVNMVQSFELE